MDFSDALRAMKDGKKVQRGIWKNQAVFGRFDPWAEIEQPAPGWAKIVVIKSNDPGVPNRAATLSQWDVVEADDWEIVE